MKIPIQQKSPFRPKRVLLQQGAFLLQKPHLPPSSSSHGNGTCHTFHLGFSAERLLGEEFKALQNGKMPKD